MKLIIYSIFAYLLLTLVHIFPVFHAYLNTYFTSLIVLINPGSINNYNMTQTEIKDRNGHFLFYLCTVVSRCAHIMPTQSLPYNLQS